MPHDARRDASVLAGTRDAWLICLPLLRLRPVVAACEGVAGVDGATVTAVLDAPDVLWRPHPRQARFLSSPAFECLYGGAAAGGKTSALLMGLLRQVHLPTFRGLFLRRTFPELREVMDRALFVFGQLGATWNEQQKRWTFESGATIEFGYCEHYRDVMRYQGQEFGTIAWDELGQCPEERIWLYLMSRCRSADPRVTCTMRASANPGGPGHAWLKRRFIAACDPNGRPIVDPTTTLTRAYVSARLADNPTMTDNDPLYEARLKALPEMERKQLLDGDWDAGEGLALGELARHVHLIRPPSDTKTMDARWPQWVGHDWGYSHPAVSCWLMKAPDGVTHVRDTLWLRRLRDDELATRIVEWCPATRRESTILYAGGDVFAQPMARTGDVTPRTADVYRAAGITVVRAPIKPGSRKRHVAHLRRLLAWRGIERDAAGAPRDGRPQLVFWDTPGNRRLVDQLESLTTDPDDPEDVLKIDATDGIGGDDGYDALRYGVAARIEAPNAREELGRDHDRMPDRTTQRLQRRSEIADPQRVVVLPPVTMWTQDDSEDVRV